MCNELHVLGKKLRTRGRREGKGAKGTVSRSKRDNEHSFGINKYDLEMPS